MLQTQYRHGPPPCHTHTYAMHIRHICTLSRIHGPREPIHDSSSEPSVWLSSLPGGASGEEPARAGDIRDAASTPGSGRCPGGGHGNPLQYSCLENPMDRGAWRAAVQRVTESQTRLSDLARTPSPSHLQVNKTLPELWMVGTG